MYGYKMIDFSLTTIGKQPLKNKEKTRREYSDTVLLVIGSMG